MGMNGQSCEAVSSAEFVYFCFPFCDVGPSVRPMRVSRFYDVACVACGIGRVARSHQGYGRVCSSPSNDWATAALVFSSAVARTRLVCRGLHGLDLSPCWPICALKSGLVSVHSRSDYLEHIERWMRNLGAPRGARCTSYMGHIPSVTIISLLSSLHSVIHPPVPSSSTTKRMGPAPTTSGSRSKTQPGVVRAGMTSAMVV